jgi:hypothetical protein
MKENGKEHNLSAGSRLAAGFFAPVGISLLTGA